MKKLIVFLTMLFMTVTVNAATLRWDASTGDVTGYIIYYGNVSGIYDNNWDVGNNLQLPDIADALSLNPGTWYFVVRAYNTVGESENSNMVDTTLATWTVPENVTPTKLVVPEPPPNATMDL
jgi:hypothetical protein